MDGAGQAAEAEAPAAAAVDSAGFRHCALFYRTEAQYITEVSGFVRGALAQGEPVLVTVPHSRAGLLREALGADANRVAFADMAGVGRNPGRIIAAVRAFADGHQGRRISAVGECAWPSRSPREFLAAAQHEALSNLAFAGTPIKALCPYDAAALPASVLAAAEQTHPLLAGPGGPVSSPGYLGPDGVPPACLEPLPEPPHGAGILPYHDDLRPVRALIGHWAVQAGLSPDRTADLVLAVSELAANTLSHTAGGGTLRVWQTADELVCDICDQGWIADPLAGRLRPAGDDLRGHGLWLVNQVCDLAELRSGPAGTTIRLHMGLGG